MRSYSRSIPLRVDETEFEAKVVLEGDALESDSVWLTATAAEGGVSLSGPPPPAPAPLPPLPPCPAGGCSGCGGCKWPYENATLPDPKQPVTGSLTDATTLACEAKCGSMVDCAGFTRKDLEHDCYFYSKAQVSGLFSHARKDVSWHPNPDSEFG